MWSGLLERREPVPVICSLRRLVKLSQSHDRLQGVCLVLCVFFRRCLHGTPVGGLGGASGGVGEGVTQTRLERDGIELIRKHSRARVEGSASVHVTAP